MMFVCGFHGGRECRDCWNVLSNYVNVGARDLMYSAPGPGPGRDWASWVVVWSTHQDGAAPIIDKSHSFSQALVSLCNIKPSRMYKCTLTSESLHGMECHVLWPVTLLGPDTLSPQVTCHSSKLIASSLTREYPMFHRIFPQFARNMQIQSDRSGIKYA